MCRWQEIDALFEEEEEELGPPTEPFQEVNLREFKLPWREAGTPNRLDDKVDSDQ